MGLNVRLGDEVGAAAVEMAFAAPLAILLTLGAVETGRALFAEAAITQAAKETARYASVRGTASGAVVTQDELKAMALQLANLPVEDTSAAVSWDPDNSPGSMVTVTIQHDFSPLTAPFAGSAFTFNATASMMVTR